MNDLGDALARGIVGGIILAALVGTAIGGLIVGVVWWLA